jgi:N-acetylmuramoyl-L-alanine amidase
MKTHRPERIVIHCTATTNGKRVSLDAIRKDHEARGFGGIGYHAIIQPDGEVHWTRGLNEVGAHVAGKNTGSLGYALAGTDRFTKRQVLALSRAVNSTTGIYNIQPWDVGCHYELDHKGKTCPNIDVKRLMAFLFLERNDALKPYLIEESEYD